MILVQVETSGPVLEGRAPEILEDFLEDCTWQVGMHGFAGVHGLLNERIQNPTPYYEAQVTQERGGEAASGFESDVPPVAVHDRGVIYGWWLEGAGSKNSPVTRFRGYHTFSETASVLNGGVALAVSEATLQPYLLRLRGEG